MKKIVPDPPITTLAPICNHENCYECLLGHASDLLRCASATVYESGESMQGQSRDLAMAGTHLISQAKAVIDQVLDRLPVGLHSQQPTVLNSLLSRKCS